MIRMRPFDKMSYSELRYKYLRQLVDARAVTFDEKDVLDIEQGIEQGKTEETLKLLKKYENMYKGLRDLKDFLFPDDEICRENLQKLLAGPEDAPAGLGGNGSYDSLRQYFEDMIKTIGTLEEDAENKVCKKIFRYDALKYEKKCQEESTAYWLQRQLGVKVCPYCNRMYTTTLFGEYRIRPDFDHFYPKSIYPYLAVNLFNLIPSCSMCNKKKRNVAEVFNKGENENLSIIYPYDESFDEPYRRLSFRVITDKKEVMMGQSDKFAIELQPKDYSDKLEFNNTGGMLAKTDVETRFEHKTKSSLTKEEEDVADRESQFWNRAKESINLLLIENFYNEHKDEIMALLRNHYQYNQDSIELIMKTLIRARYPEATEQDVKSFARGMLYFAFLNHEEWGNSPLNKLKSDILEQLDEIENTRIDSIDRGDEDDE